MFEFRFVKKRYDAAPQKDAAPKYASRFKNGEGASAGKNKTQTTAFMFVLKTAGGRISRGYIRAKACRRRAHRRQTCHRCGRVVRGKCVGREGCRRKARYKKMCRGDVSAEGASVSEGARRGRLIGRSRVRGVGAPARSSPHLSNTPAGRAKLQSTAPASSSPHGHVSAGRL